MPEMNPVIGEYLQQEEEVYANALPEIEEFEEAFEIEHQQEEVDPSKKQRITWKQMIEDEENKLKLKMMAEKGIQENLPPLTEQEAARIKENKNPDDEDPDAVKQVGSINPVDDFKKMISDRKTDRVSTALRQMQQVIERYIRCSLNGDLYEKALECLINLREAAVQEDEAPTFNKFLEKIK